MSYFSLSGADIPAYVGAPAIPDESFSALSADIVFLLLSSTKHYSLRTRRSGEGTTQSNSQRKDCQCNGNSCPGEEITL